MNKQRYVIFLGLALVGSSLLWSGCLGTDASLPSSIEPQKSNDKEVHYSWPASIFTDQSGNETDPPLWYNPDTHPSFVQQFVPLVGVKNNMITKSDIVVTSENNLLVTTNDQVQKSSDSGEEWKVVHDFRHPEFDDRFESEGSSLIYDDHDSRLWLHHLNTNGCNELFASDDEGESWDQPTVYRWPTSCAQRAEQSAYYWRAYAPELISSSPGPETPPLPNLSDRVLYLCGTLGSMSLGCHISVDEGETWRGRPIVLDDPNCSFKGFAREMIFGSPAVHPDGTIMIPVFHSGGSLNDNDPTGVVPDQPICENHPMVAISQDSGYSWQLRSHTGETGQLERSPALTVAEDGTAYMAFRDRDHSVQILRSTDKFSTWEGPFQISPASHELNSHVSIVQGDSDRIVVAYYGTRSEQDHESGPPTAPETADANSIWHLYTTTSFNADQEEPGFVTKQVTPDQGPVQVGCVHQIQDYQSDCDNLGTSVRMVRGDDGRAYIAFIDGCTIKNGCVNDLHGAWQGRESQVAVAVQNSGQSLFSEQGTLEPLGLIYPQPAKKAGIESEG